MKKKVFLPLLAALILVVGGTALLAVHVHPANPEVVHTHEWGQWGDPDPDENNGKNAQFIQFRRCTNCGLAQFRVVLEVK